MIIVDYKLRTRCPVKFEYTGVYFLCVSDQGIRLKYSLIYASTNIYKSHNNPKSKEPNTNL